MHTSGRMVFTMTLLAAATPFVLPTVLAPSGNIHPALIGNAHPANFANPHPADFGNPHPANFGDPHPANFGDPHPAAHVDAHAAFPNEIADGANVRIDPSQVDGHVTFAFPHAAHVTIVLPDGVQFAVADNRGFDNGFVGDGHHGDGHRNGTAGVANTPGGAVVADKNGQVLPPTGSEVVKDKNGQVLPPVGSAAVTDKKGQVLPPAGADVVAHPPFNEPAGAQTHVAPHGAH
jgi:hypothetical protein